jgi:hypothetical protein
VGAGVGLAGLPTSGAARGLDATETGHEQLAGGAGGRTARSRLYPVPADFHEGTPQRLRAKRGCFKP